MNKFLAQCGVCSRREADRLLEQGRVQVNGRTAIVGQSVCEQDSITVNGKLLQGRERTVVLAYYKPIGVVCTENDRHARIKISDVVKTAERVTYAGRLDKDSEGLLLLTNDGDLIESMMRGSNRHEKEYVVKADKEITDDFLSKMAAGIYLKELNLTTRACRVEQIGKYTFRIVLTQGVNRQIRRMCEACGYRVKNLKRVRVMNILLGNMKPGELREIAGDELENLIAMAKTGE